MQHIYDPKKYTENAYFCSTSRQIKWTLIKNKGPALLIWYISANAKSANATNNILVIKIPLGYGVYLLGHKRKHARLCCLVKYIANIWHTQYLLYIFMNPLKAPTALYHTMFNKKGNPHKMLCNPITAL